MQGVGRVLDWFRAECNNGGGASSGNYWRNESIIINKAYELINWPSSALRHTVTRARRVEIKGQTKATLTVTRAHR